MTGLPMVYRQRLEPPFVTEAEPYDLEVFDNAVVVVLDDGERLVFDRADLAAAIAVEDVRRRVA